MKLKILSLIYFANLAFLYSQTNQNCNGYPCFDLTKGDKNIKDLVRDKYPGYLADIVNSPKKLKPFSSPIKIKNYELFYLDKDTVEIYFTYDTITIDTSFKYVFNRSDDASLYVQEKTNFKLYGDFTIKNDTCIYERIWKIEYSSPKGKYNIPDSIYKYFINPNRTHILGALKPIQVFKQGNFISIYIMGDIPLNCYDHNISNAVESSYLAKVMINKHSMKTNFMALEDKILRKYCWPQCENFWPF